MLELHNQKRTKVHLPDYPYQQDVQHRILLADLTPLHYRVLEELLFSPLKVSIKKLARSLELEEHQLVAVLQRFASTRLLTLEQDHALIDKDLRKYFEFQIARFDPDFKPDMEFLQGLLRLVPIQVLPSWYSIPRTSNNIFESIVERYLLTPHIFQRYLNDLHFSHPAADAIVRDLFQSPQLRLSTSDLIAKYNLPREAFEEIMITLEYHFVACVSYVREEDHWHEIVTPFYEWRQYLLTLRQMDLTPLKGPIQRAISSDYAFVEEMSRQLKTPTPYDPDNRASARLIALHLAEVRQRKLVPTLGGREWLQLDSEQQALYLYRHPVSTDKRLREAEKGARRLLNRGWVDLDTYLSGTTIPLSDESAIQLRRSGKQWRYALPTYTDEERTFFRSVTLEWLVECGMVAQGTCNGRECISLTPLGCRLFEE